MVDTHSKTELKQLVNGADTYEQGKVVFDAVLPQLSKGETVRFSLHGTRALSSSFMHGLFGNLLEVFGKEGLRARLKITDYLPSQAQYIKEYIQQYEA